MQIYENPFNMGKKEKDIFFTNEMIKLTDFHIKNCASYKKMMSAINYESSSVNHYEDISFLPVTLFKQIKMSSINSDEDLYKTITSSGTTGQKKSQIVLNSETRINQQQVLSSIVGDFIGSKRIPMLIIDCPSIIKNKDNYSARTAGILGFSLFGTRRTFALNDDMSLNLENINDFLNKYGNDKFLIFGFTYIVWEYFYGELKKSNIKINLKNGILIHVGGWKKLIDKAVSKDEFKESLNEEFGIEKVFDYYGMAEQSGSIFMECEYSNLHVSDYSALIIRDTKDFSPCKIGEKGLIQVMSLIPKSYPGHSLLTEDEGAILGVDDCPCGRKGVYFKVIGRAKRAELRGCSDVLK